MKWIRFLAMDKTDVRCFIKERETTCHTKSQLELIPSTKDLNRHIFVVLKNVASFFIGGVFLNDEKEDLVAKSTIVSP